MMLQSLVSTNFFNFHDSNSPHDLNAYLFDFFEHGQTSTIVSANGIRRGVAGMFFRISI